MTYNPNYFEDRIVSQHDDKSFDAGYTNGYEKGHRDALREYRKKTEREYRKKTETLRKLVIGLLQSIDPS